MDCGQPSNLTRADISYNTTTYNSTATVTCKAGYYDPFGREFVELTCTQLGSWSRVWKYCSPYPTNGSPNSPLLRDSLDVASTTVDTESPGGIPTTDLANGFNTATSGGNSIKDSTGTCAVTLPAFVPKHPSPFLLA